MELSELNKTGCSRLNYALRAKGKTAADMGRATGLTKSSISRYLKGQSVPKQNPLSLMADYLGVNPAWLMGYDVPMIIDNSADLILESEKLALVIETLTPENRDNLLKYAQWLVDNQAKEDGQ